MAGSMELGDLYDPFQCKLSYASMKRYRFCCQNPWYQQIPSEWGIRSLYFALKAFFREMPPFQSLDFRTTIIIVHWKHSDRLNNLIAFPRLHYLRYIQGYRVLKFPQRCSFLSSTPISVGKVNSFWLILSFIWCLFNIFGYAGLPVSNLYYVTGQQKEKWGISGTQLTYYSRSV